ncbi:MAG: HGxxPAAW family protein [Candidatus Nanopelagicales bacterium]
MTAGHDNHGRTPANWTGATIIMLAFVVGTLGVVLDQQIVFWIGVAMVLVGVVAWKVMAGMESGDHSMT